MIRLIVPGEPKAQTRPRARRVGAGVRIHDTRETANARAAAREIVADQWAIRDPLEGLLKVSIVAIFPCPKSHQRKRDPPRLRFKPNGKDIDNIVKFYMDTMNGLVYGDDTQVCSLHAAKFYAAQGQEPMTVIEVERINTGEFQSSTSG